VEASTGSLGHGIGIAVGMALASKIKGHGRDVYTLIGDGEANEGSVWEAVMVAVDRKLDNFTILYDNNMSHSRGLQIVEPAARFAAFGCHAIDVDGHDLAALAKALAEPAHGAKAIVCHTKKGFGCPTLLKDQYAWHRRSPNDAELVQLLGELDA
jgi:transketolase